MHEQTAERPAKKRVLVISGIVLGVILCAVLFTFVINRFTFRIDVHADATVIHHHGEPYMDAGADPQIIGTILFPNGLTPDCVVTSEGTVDVDRLGTYYITYTAQYCGKTAVAHRTVEVVDTTAPVITLVSTPEHVTFEGDSYQEEGFSAYDSYDGDITHLVIREEVDDHTIVYSVEDSSGNKTSIAREIEYTTRVFPELILLGEEEYVIYAGSSFSDPGFMAKQVEEGDLNDRVTVLGEVDPYFPGTYVLQYSVTNDLGGTTVVERTVQVIAHPAVETVNPQTKVIYLTFDDGPSQYTEDLLDILARYNVKATFFVTGFGRRSVMKRIVNEGHAIGVHSVTHDYSEIYASMDAYFQDLYSMQQIIYEQTGYRTTLLRFPGGSSNTASRFNKGIMTKLTQAVTYAGFQYFDWNVTSGDAGEVTTAEEVYENVTTGISQLRYAVVLQHDIKDFSVEAVEDIIIWGLNNGYTFRALEANSPVCHHHVNN